MTKGNGLVATVGIDGEIAARGPGHAAGLCRPGTGQPEAHTADGFFLTGDIGQLTCRRAGADHRSQERHHYSRRREPQRQGNRGRALHHHPGIREAAVVAMPHERLGEGVCAYPHPARSDRSRPGSARAVARVYRLARAAGPPENSRAGDPRSDDLPRTPSGKVRKDVLRRQLREDGERCVNRQYPAGCPSPWANLKAQ